jgi:AcrR family transcriptional regulator
MCAVESRKPGRPRSPELEARRRSQILDTAAKVFAGFGFAATDVQVIADRIGVGKGTVYRYFPTKEALFLAAVERGLAELTAEMDAVLDQPADDPVRQIRPAIRAYLAFFHRRPGMAELFIQERAAFPHHHRPLYFSTQDNNEHECKHAAFWQRLVETGKVRPMPAERFFAVVGDLLYGTILTNLLSGRPADPDAQTEDILDVILNGMLADGRGGNRETGRPGEKDAQRKGNKR